MVKDRKNRLLLLIAIIAASAICVCSQSNETYASCYDAGGHFSVNTNAEIVTYGSFKDIGGTTQSNAGVRWACDASSANSVNHAILFITDKQGFTSSGGNYTFNVNVAINPDSEYNPVAIMGLGRDVQGNGIARAADVKLCVIRSDCENRKMDNEVFSTVGGNSLSNPLYITRSGTLSSGYDSWVKPSTSNVTPININGKKLVEKASPIASRSTSEYDVYAIYNYRCYRTVGYNCGTSMMYLTVKKSSSTTPPSEDDPPDEYGCRMDTNYTFDIYQGSNAARIGVRNSTKSTSFVYSPSNASGSAPDVYAKPGDSIQFIYNICAGAAPANEAGNQNRSYHFNPSGISSTSSKSYLFGNSVSSWSNGNFGVHNNYQLSTRSPSTTNYDCSVYNTTSRYVSSHYQIPGLNTETTNGCNAARQTQPSDVGSYIQQSISWNALSVTSWLEQRSYQRSHRDCSTDESGNRHCYTWYETVYYYVRVYDSTDNGERVGTARVYIPYNYKIKVTARDPSVRHVSVGTTISMTYDLSVLGRVNSKVQSGTEYATHTKPTTYQTFVWYEGANETESSIKGKLGQSLGNNSGYFSRSNPASGKLIVGSSSGNKYTGNNTLSSVNVTVPTNLSIGTKVCVATSVYPADSHNNPALADTGSVDQSVALTTGYSGYYVSEPSCFTVSKKPTFAVRGGSGLYALGDISTTSFTAEGITYGSWSEYIIASAGRVRGTSSGAATWGGNGSGGSTRSCSYSSMTLANTNCSTGDLGSLTTLLSSSSSSPKNVVEQIRTRYTSDVPSNKLVRTNNPISVSGGCSWDADRATYVPVSWSSSYFNCLSNGSFYFKGASGITMTIGDGTHENWYEGTDNPYTGHTTIYEADDIIINENLRHGSTTLKDNSVFTSTSHQTQIIVIAKNSITINSNVTRVDAWLIAPTIKTCEADPSNMNAFVCNKQLHVNGPVFTKHLYLYRTYGSGPSDFSSSPYTNQGTRHYLATPAEIFRIGPETYFWAYSQSTRYSQAYTTYQRELAPRY